MKDPLLATSLAAAVPLWAAQFCKEPLREVLDPKVIESVLARIQGAGEAILYRVPGKTADGFNALAEGIARLAFMPGGVTAFGLRFRYEPGRWEQGEHGTRIGSATEASASEVREMLAAVPKPGSAARRGNRGGRSR